MEYFQAISEKKIQKFMSDFYFEIRSNVGTNIQYSVCDTFIILFNMYPISIK